MTSLPRPGPGSVTWKVTREAIVVIGWGRAILLQLAHPLVAAGVDAHSSFRADRFGGFRRLHGTVGSMLALTFGDRRAVEAAAAGINAIHDRVSGSLAEDAGVFPAGTRYSAHDPELLAWVHATLVESMPLIYEQLVGPLTPDEKDAYCDEARSIGPLLGIPDDLMPRRAASLDAYMSRMYAGGRIHVTDEARRLARAVLFPRFSALLWPPFRLLRLTTVGLLPPAIREGYGFRWTAGEDRALRRWSRAVRAARRVTPPLLREWPAARRAA